MQESKSDPKEKVAVASVIIGIISILAGWACIFIPSLGLRMVFGILDAYLSFFIFVSIIGLSLGILGVKSKRKKIAIVGIFLSLIGLISLILFLLIDLGIIYIKTVQ